MKNYKITVNGVAYDVAVEEVAAGTVSSKPTPVVAAPQKAVPKAAPKASGKEGSIKVKAPMPGKILAVKANPGQALKKGDVIIVLEAMKMENEVVAPEDGTVASIEVAAGDAVEAGGILATLN